MKRKVSLRTHVLLVLFGALATLILVFQLSNQLIWNRIYMNENRKEIKEVYLDLSYAVRARDEVSEEELLQKIVDYKDNRNVLFGLEGDRDWSFKLLTEKTVSSLDREFLMARLQDNLLNRNSGIVKVLEKSDDYIIQYVVNAENGNRFIECYGYMVDENGVQKKFILSKPLEYVYAAFSVSKLFTLYMSLVMLVAAYLLMTFITYRITEPIYQLNAISMRMKKLDFSARYEGKNQDEIGELGNNMNELSSQLERTFLQLQLTNDKLSKEVSEKEKQDEMRKDFISNVSHELKTPIALIQGYAEGLKELPKDDPESMEYYCDVIVDEAEKMARLVKKLTTLNQLEFGADGLEENPFDIMEMIRNMVSGSKKMQEEHHAKVTVFGPSQCIVLGDEFKIEEVLNNYYSNAFNHLDEPREITFRFDDLGPNIRISVKNTGPNIPEEELEKIWIKFYKVDRARTRAYGGSGIGLSIVKAIMDAHHEECGVYNEEDGVVFWFEVKKFGELITQDGSDYR